MILLGKYEKIWYVFGTQVYFFNDFELSVKNLLNLVLKRPGTVLNLWTWDLNE